MASPLVLLATLLSLFDLSAALCKNHAGKQVDWFAGYKLPKQSTHSNPIVQTGHAYAYMDTQSTSGFQMSPFGLNIASGHAVYNTLKQYYDCLASKTCFYLLYNDQMPDGETDGYRAHAKGVVFCNNGLCFWLIHSIPRFVDDKSYSYPDTGTKNGQSLLCISFKITELAKIGNLLYYAQLSIYASNLPSSYLTMYPDIGMVGSMSEVVGGKCVGAAPFWIQKDIISMENMKFQCFNKHRKWDADVYADLVAKTLGIDMFVETWLNGPGEDLPAQCDSSYGGKVYNLRAVGSVAGTNFSSAVDHSKICFSDKIQKPYVCIGDINRQPSQKGRGGGTCCFSHPLVWKAYRDIVNTVECCDGKNLLTYNQCAKGA